MSKQNKKRIIVVVGPFRSGTSVLTKGLSTLGVLLTAPLDYFPPHNPKGDWEDAQFQNFSNELLNEISVFTKRSRDILSTTQEEVKFLREQGFIKRAVKLLFNKLSDSKPLGIKYPRASIFLPFWKEVFKELNLHVSFVIALRAPESSAASFAEFTKEPLEKPFWIWISFLLSILEHSEGYSRILVDYQELLKNPARQIKRVAQALELDVQQELLEDYVTDFVDPSLCHFKPARRRDENNNSPEKKKENLWRNDICKKLSNEMYQQLFAVATDQISFQNLKKSFEKWKKEFLSVASLLQLIEKNDFCFNYRQQHFEQHAMAELHKMKNTFAASIAEKTNFIIQLEQIIRQQDLQLKSLLLTTCERSS